MKIMTKIAAATQAPSKVDAALRHQKPASADTFARKCGRPGYGGYANNGGSYGTTAPLLSTSEIFTTGDLLATTSSRY